MAEEEFEVQEETKKAKGGIVKWIIMGVLLLGLGGGGYFLYPKLFPPGEKADAQAEEQAAQPEGEVGTEDYQQVALSPFVVNLADPLGRRYLKLVLGVEVVNGAAASELQNKEAKVRDALILLLSSKTYQELSSMENKLMLKQQIVDRLNQILGGSKVVEVYFTELVIQ